jgi:PHP domain
MKKVWSLVIAAIIVLVLLGAVAFLPAAPPPQGADGSNDPGPASSNVTIVYNPYDLAGPWYKGQLHCHSTNSDGQLAPEAVVARYADMGFDFIALTDHNTITKVNGSILVLGQEYGKGSVEATSITHMNGINVTWVPTTSDSVQQRIDNISAQNGLASLNHPTAWPFTYPHDVLMGLANYTDLEVYNGNHDSYASTQWDEVLSAEHRVWGIATDDAHRAEQFGRAWIEVRLTGPVTTDAVLDAIRHGSFYATQGPLITDVNVSEGNLTVRCPDADRIVFIGKGGQVLASFAGSEASYHFKGNESYVRAEVLRNGLKAWTQPVFIEPEPSATSSLVQTDQHGPALVEREALELALPPTVRQF